ncbi:Uma2 family endonuclease [Limnoglobus roseus]|uniref:Uma2 family endonuclease n=1 Tax=Limnoglobus roseus TaxID=2598579 RepID=A0A5C1A6B7_9BACT|nr:Uma2 family endonuclease [Limnoglobus roseus]QEL14701.1 Uma2 family endonuclease [Limnoglobus roseus]
MSPAVATPPQTPPPKATVPVSTTPASITPPPLCLSTGPQLHALTVKQYHQMIDAGVFSEDERVELLNGLLVRKMTIKPPHATALGLLLDALRLSLPAGWRVRVQDPIELDVSEPEPDAAVVRGDARTFAARHPRPAEIGLVVEVADRSLAYDRGEKLRAYAANNVSLYWIVNLVDNRVEVYSQPSGPTAVPSFGSVQTYAPGQSVPLTLDGTAVATIAVADVLP